MTTLARRIMILLAIAAIIILGWWLYNNYQEQNLPIPAISEDYQKIGIVNMALDHPIKIQNVLAGNDLLIVINRDSPYYKNIISLARQLGNYGSDIRFELSLYDSNQDSIIDNEDPIWGDLRAIVFTDNGRSYVVKTLPEVGIHGILLKHITPKGNHTVLLSDGSERVLFELGAPLKGLSETNTPQIKVDPYKLPGNP